MSLTISLRVPDGLVVAADSLASTHGMIRIAADVTAKCPECSKQIKLEKLKLPPIQGPASTKSFAQKLFPFWKDESGKDQFGVATYGSGFLAGKTVYYHAKELEAELATKKEKIKGVTDAADIIGKRFAELVRKDVGGIEKLPKDAFVVGFQVVGYDKRIGKTIVVEIRKKTVKKVNDKPGCTYGGEGQLVEKMWELGKLGRPIIYELLSLQDAIDYAHFLIDTTAKFQRFTNTVPSVGGDIDIALVTAYGGFKWIQRKRIQRILEEQEK